MLSHNTDPTFKQFLYLYRLYMKHVLQVKYHDLEPKRLYTKWCKDLEREDDSLAANYIEVLDRMVCSDYLNNPNNQTPRYICWPDLLLSIYRKPRYYEPLKQDLTDAPIHTHIRATGLYAGGPPLISNRVDTVINNTNGGINNTPEHLIELMGWYGAYKPHEAWLVQPVIQLNITTRIARWSAQEAERAQRISQHNTWLDQGNHDLPLLVAQYQESPPIPYELANQLVRDLIQTWSWDQVWHPWLSGLINIIINKRIDDPIL